MKLQITVSSSAVAHRVVDALAQLGHDATADALLPGLVEVGLADAGDAPVVHRIASMLDHPAGSAAA